MSAHLNNQSGNHVSGTSATAKDGKGKRELDVLVMSFGYKQGPPPVANVVWDVRFLKNPYWVEELRPLTGLDSRVQEYVLQQPLAQDFLASMMEIFDKTLPRVVEHKVERYIIALGCTGGQHRSTTLVETLGKLLRERFPEYSVTLKHRELAHLQGNPVSNEQGASVQ
jgi:UPF0042 nucleotide-binding protein